MPTNNDHIPTVRYSMKNNWSNSIHSLMQTFISAGSKKGVARLQQLNNGLDTNSKEVIHNTGIKTADRAIEIERSNVGGKKSGYVPTGNLMRSIEAHDYESGMRTEIAPHAMSKADYEYGQAVEFGTKKMAAEPFMKPAGNEISSHLDEITHKAFKKSTEEG